MNKKPELYSLWTVEAQTEEERKRSKLPPHIPAPKLKLPVPFSHATLHFDQSRSDQLPPGACM